MISSTTAGNAVVDAFIVESEKWKVESYVSPAGIP